MCTRCSFIGGLAAFALAPAVASARTGDPQALELAVPRMQRINDTVWLAQLTSNVWIHTTTHLLDGKIYYPANGLIVVDGRDATLVDTAWSPDQMRALVSAWDALGKARISKAVVTHFHSDRLGGIPYLQQRGIPAYGNPTTIGLAVDRGFTPPKPVHELDRRPQNLGSLELFFPGAGHTIDNIVVWVPADGVLFGGCLVKATTASDLGNLADADVTAYAATMQRLISRYRPRHVIPGHGTISGDSLEHTLDLARTQK